MKIGERDMYSFDLFDTLITRKTATPWGIFALIQKKLNTCQEYQEISGHISANFYELRINAEDLARLNNKSKGIEEVTLEDIYTAMATSGCLSLEEQIILCDLEKITEIENVVGIEENIAKVKSLISQGEEVILISDMYLDNGTILEMLAKVDEIFNKIPIYISSELMKRKTSGNLYRKIKELVNIEYTEWIHCGDNLYQDIEIPIEIGITVQHFQPEQLSAFEENLILQYGNNVLLQLMIGTAKNARRQNELITTAEKIGCTFSGPILYSYTEWILGECKRKDIKRLYFIARDGYLIKKIADILIEKNNMNIETFYIYGSRKAWRIPSLSKEHFNLYQIIHWSYTSKIKTIGSLAEVLMIPVEELYPFLPLFCRDAIIQTSEQSLRYIVQRLDRDVEFQEYFLKKHADMRKLVKEYLRQEIDMSDDAFAFVEVSGGGLTQGCLKNLLKGQYDKPIRTFFFKIDRVNLMDDCINDTFLPSLLKNNLVVEMLCRAPHGQTLGYERREQRVLPILEGKEGEAFLQLGFMEYLKGIECYVKQMAELQKEKKVTMDSVDILLKYLNYIACEPDNTTLEFFASFPNSETGREKQLVEYAPKLTKEDIDNIYLKRTTESLENYYQGTNFEYSLLRCNKEELEYIEQCKKDYHLARGKLARQEKIREEEKMKKKFGYAIEFPCEILEENIVIYGAGKFGNSLYNKITSLGKSKIIQWVDKEYEKYNQQGINRVEPPEVIGTREYDQLVIAVMKKDLAVDIQKELIERGISKEKIIWM